MTAPKKISPKAEGLFLILLCIISLTVGSILLGGFHKLDPDTHFYFNIRLENTSLLHLWETYVRSNYGFYRGPGVLLSMAVVKNFTLLQPSIFTSIILALIAKLLFLFVLSKTFQLKILDSIFVASIYYLTPLWIDSGFSIARSLNDLFSAVILTAYYFTIETINRKSIHTSKYLIIRVLLTIVFSAIFFAIYELYIFLLPFIFIKEIRIKQISISIRMFVVTSALALITAIFLLLPQSKLNLPNTSITAIVANIFQYMSSKYFLLQSSTIFPKNIQLTITGIALFLGAYIYFRNLRNNAKVISLVGVGILIFFMSLDTGSTSGKINWNVFFVITTLLLSPIIRLDTNDVLLPYARLMLLIAFATLNVGAIDYLYLTLENQDTASFTNSIFRGLTTHFIISK